jgi:hypothetical protein
MSSRTKCSLMAMASSAASLDSWYQGRARSVHAPGWRSGRGELGALSISHQRAAESASGWHPGVHRLEREFAVDLRSSRGIDGERGALMALRCSPLVSRRVRDRSPARRRSRRPSAV